MDIRGLRNIFQNRSSYIRQIEDGPSSSSDDEDDGSSSDNELSEEEGPEFP